MIHKGFLKECKYIEQKVVRHTIHELENLFDDFDEELIKDIELMFLQKTVLEKIFFRELF